ncbi:MAG: oligopeptide transporter, OPT family [Nevskiales bacterium]|nr:oligopeptide transporter, OPT family [Nevskiales bacterium]
MQRSHLGLFAGLTVSASIPAAVISMGVLKLFGNSNILENNIVQTAASAGESLAAGVIFTIPALVLLGYWNVFDYWWVSVIAGLGGLLGVLFTIPLRRSLIVEQGLAFPEGKATAEVLRVGDGGGAGLRFLGWAGLAGAAVKFAETGLRLWPGSVGAGTWLGGGVIGYVGTNLSPALLSVGYIVGLNIAVLVFLGGAISWYLAIPLYGAVFAADDPVIGPMISAGTPALDVAWQIWTSKIRYLGVGAMLIGGIWALISMRASLLSGVRSGLALHGGDNRSELPHTEQDAPMKLVLIAIAVMIVPIFMVYETAVSSVGIGLLMAVIMVVAGFLFASVAAYMAGLVGSSNNPISGITIATILFSSLILLWLMGSGAEAGPTAAIMIGAVVCCAAAIGGDNMQDLKAGHIVGATPWRQQLMQGVGVISSVLVMAPILNLLLKAYGLGAPTEDHPNALLAPQATLMASVAQGVFHGGLPWGMIATGVGIGAAIIAWDEWLKARKAEFRAPVLAVAVGIYLPLELSVPILIGGVIAHLAERYNASRCSPEQAEHHQRNGMLCAAGLITGEALIGIFMAVPIVVTSDPEVLALPASMQIGAPLGLAVICAVVYAMYRVAAPRQVT